MLTIEKIIELEEKRAKAWLDQDKDALRKHLHKDYLEINIFGRFSKQQALDDLFDQHQLLEYQMSEQKRIDLGETAWGLSYRVKEKLKSGGQVSAFECFVIAIYKQEGKNWLLRLWQITPLNA